MKEAIIEFVKQIQSESNKWTLFDEATTKQGLVLRVLAYLGWDPYNIDEVSPEYSVGSGKVDYALRHQDHPRVFIEVKRAGEELDKHQDQILNYSFMAGIKLAVLTNGISWWFYLPLNEGSWEQRKFYAINMYDQDASDVSQRFIDFLEKENVITGGAVENAQEILGDKNKVALIDAALPKAFEKIITEPDELLIELVVETAERMCGYRPDHEVVCEYIKSWVQHKKSKPQVPAAKVLPKTTKNDTNSDKKIGDFVRTYLYQLLREGLLPIGILLNLEDEGYCKKELNLNYPLLKRIDPYQNVSEQRYINSYPRYYKNEVIIGEERYLITSQWVVRNIGPLKKWLEKQGLNDWVEKMKQFLGQ